MRIFFAAFALHLLILVGSSACVSTPAKSPAEVVSAPSTAGQLTHPFLWDVHAKTTTTPASFLFGTVHVSVDPHKELPPSVWRAFQDAPCFVMEADQQAMEPRAVLAMAKQPPGKHLSAELKPETWKQLTKKLAPMVPADVLDQSQAWFAGLVYMQTLLPHDVDPMDSVFLGEAKKAGKSIHYLEGWREAMTAFARVTTADDLDDIVAHDDESQKELDELVRAYRSGEEAAIERAIKASNERGSGAARAADKEKALLENRNRVWLPRLVKILTKERCFVAVGAGHLVGEASLLRLLQAQGFLSVRRQ